MSIKDTKGEYNSENGKIAVFLGRGVYDFTENTIVEGLKRNGFVVLGNRKANSITEATTNEGLKDALKSPQSLLFFNKENIGLARDIGGSHKNRIFVDGRDDPYINPIGLISAKLYLKRELLKAWPVQLKKVYPFSFGIELRYPNSRNLNEKEIDIYAGFNLNTHKARALYQKLIEDYKGNTKLNITIQNTGERSYNNKSGEALETPLYYSLLKASKFVISPRGAGQDCARFWEAISAGAVVVSEEISIYYPLQKDIHYISFNSVAELRTKLLYIESDPDGIYRNIKKNLALVENEQTSKSRVKLVLENIEKQRTPFLDSLALLYAVLYNLIAFFYILAQRKYRHKSIVR